jgi:RHS repeat-associated protein
MDYRVWQPRRSADANGTVMRFEFTPLGQLAASWTTGNAGDGDQAGPSVRLDYDLRAFADRGEPISAGATRRVSLDGDETIRSRTYADGFGRPLQTRVQAADTRFGDETTGDGLLSPDQTVAPGPVTGRVRAPGDPLNVLVSGLTNYDAKGRPVERHESFYDVGLDYAEPTAAQLRNATRAEYDPRGVVLATIGADGARVSTVPGTPPALDRPGDAEPSPWVAFAYDANDNAGRTHGAPAPVPASHLDTPSSAEVDPAGRPVRAVARNRVAGGPVTELVTTTAYDPAGNRARVIDELGRTAFAVVADLLGRPLRSQTLDAGTTTAVYDAAGSRIEVRDQRGALTLTAADLAGRPHATWARDDAAGAVTLRELAAYGDGGSPAQPAAERAAARAGYRLGKLVTQLDEAGRADIAGYDHLGNPTGKTRRVVGDAAIEAGWTAAWDAPAAQDVLEPGLTWDAEHDLLGRVRRIRYPADPDGRRRVLEPEYHEAGGLRRVSLDGQAFVEHIARDARGRRTLVAHANRLVTLSDYDPLTGELTRVWTGPATGGPGPVWSPGGATLRDTGYGYDLAGNVTAVRERAPGSGTGVTPDALDRSFAYDALYRLTGADGRECDRPPELPWAAGPGCTDETATRAYRETYGYDDAGNLTTVAHVAAGGGFTRTLALVPGSNRLARTETGPDQADYTYDAAGFLVGETTSRHFEWDHAGRLRRFRVQAGAGPASVVVHYLHDQAGRRVKRLVAKQNGPAEATVTIDDGYEVNRRGTGPAAVVNATVHVSDGGSPIATARSGPALPGDGGADIPVAYHFGDAVGSAVLVVGGADATSAATVKREESSPWGATTFGSYARKRYRWAGKERDEASGLYDFGARHYAPWLGRWVSADPVGPADGLNLYAYARNNPVSRIDPGGTDSEPNEAGAGADNGYRDAGAGPTDVSGAGAQAPNPPTSTDGTVAPPTNNTEPNVPLWGVKDLPNAAPPAAAVIGGSVARGAPVAGGVNGGPPPAFNPATDGINLNPGGGMGNAPAQAPGVPEAPIEAPPTGPAQPAAAPGAATESAVAPGAATEAATAPGLLTDALVLAGRVLTGAAVVISTGMTFHGDAPLGPPAPTLVELDQTIVRIAAQQNARLSQAVKAGDYSLLKLYRPGLYNRMVSELDRAKTDPWAYYKAFKILTWAYGKTLEIMVDEALQVDDVAGGYFEHQGGKSQPDWILRGVGGDGNGLMYDLTTDDPQTIQDHLDRPGYGPNLRIVPYKPPW